MVSACVEQKSNVESILCRNCLGGKKSGLANVWLVRVLLRQSSCG